MSRTDVHRPGWVQDQDPYLRRFFVTAHNHWHEERFPCTHTPPCPPGPWETTPTHRVRRSVPCDLGEPQARCGPRYRGGGNPYCGCRVCTGHHSRKLAARQDRVWWRNTRRQLLTAAAGDRDTLDVGPFRPSVW